ncbi:10569_t:CDS:10 [Cetraspora pellucida]|uniref:10569_t:CDS:1 n=1 Tax=Cetraspora pellucida TaxID=1433469 RepID=A0A9N9DTE4_9GLOM|nr:10569_t:CDS:10 [Cetraspora pellucida]
MSSKQRRMDHSDDEGTHHSRDKFTRERRSSLDHNNSSPEDRDTANYSDRRSKRRRSISPDSRRPQQLEGDHYIPNYEKDGYTPAPRYVGRPGDMRFPPHGFPVGLSLGPAPQIIPPGGPLMAMDWTGPGRQEPLKDPDQLDFLVTFKYYAEFLQVSNQKTRYTDDDLHKKYNDYKEAFGIKQLKTFFEAHKKEEWFLEKYHPKYMEPRIAATKELKKKNYQNFITDLKRGLLDNIVNDVEENKEDTKTDESTADKTEQDEDANRLFIKSVSPNISRQKIEEMCKEIPGFKYLALSEPNPQKKFHRLGWIVFEEGSDMDAAYEKLNEQKIDEFVFYLARHKNQTGPVRNRTTPDAANTLERLKKDLEMAIKLSEKLDKDVDNTMTGSQHIKQRLILIDDGHRREEINNVKRILDIHIEYLRRTHLFCYYCGCESDSVEELNRKCPGRHLRSLPGSNDVKSAGKSLKEKQINATTWLKTLDNKINYKTEPLKYENEVEKNGGLNIKQVLENFYNENINEVEPGRKFKCNLCSKLFKGADFVKKHIDYKHHSTVETTMNDAKFYNNYVLDPNHLLPTTPPNPTAALVPQSVTPIPPNPFPVMANAPPPPFMNFSFPIMSAAAGTPHDQIPRIGFDGRDDSRERGSRQTSDSRRQPSRPNDLNAGSDPRQVKSYVDLDAPAEGDIEIKY